MLNTMKQRAGLFAVLVCAMAFGVSGVANATSYDIAPVTTAITTQITDSLPTILAIAGGLIALGLVLKLIRRVAKV